MKVEAWPVDPSLYLAFLAVMAVMAITPGPANLFAVAVGASRGRGAVLAAVAGMNTATLVWFGAAAVGLGGVDVAHFWATLVLLGLGWNFGFLGASALVLECHRPEEKTRVQSLNDFIVFSLMAIGSFASGGLLSAYGWNAVLWVSFAPLGLALVALALAMRRRIADARPAGHSPVE